MLGIADVRMSSPKAPLLEGRRGAGRVRWWMINLTGFGIEGDC